MNSTLKILILVPLALGFSNLSDAREEESKQTKPLVYVPVPPYEYLIEKIAGELINVKSICGPNDDPHDYLPTVRQLVEISDADMLFSGELGFESNFFVKVGEGEDAPQAFNLLDGLSLLEGSCDHPSHRLDATEKEKRAHNHENLHDPHVWLSPVVLGKQAGSVGEAIKKLLPQAEHAVIDANVKSFREELALVNLELKESLSPLKGTRIYVYHAAFAYFARDYGLEQIAVEVGNRSPSPKQLVKLSQKAREDGVKLVFAQPQFDQTSARALAESINGKVATLDPLERNILKNLRSISSLVMQTKDS